ncbi:hypothetical protein Cob_v007649 [Colletotrichum orbiculare MAFF 240422]|uniref:Uncharacterized protein n=1 Tax=Colletotrichum orbiculare (strain 104-T / ATCC 96160 / CBS 514.97 / LARS 414 / MAFF 240422) TaxID=1213857 RepID=A0A484FNJ7_COLOR|nr:hypothetical protein Cob_v007649 [Colletotrichum orbiculare MAFF 240422]
MDAGEATRDAPEDPPATPKNKTSPHREWITSSKCVSPLDEAPARSVQVMSQKTPCATFSVSPCWRPWGFSFSSSAFESG